MSEISKNNQATNRVIDDWMLRALDAYQHEGVEQQCLESLLLWWLGFGDPVDDEATASSLLFQISKESVQALRAQRLAFSALRFTGESQGPDGSAAPEAS